MIGTTVQFGFNGKNLFVPYGTATVKENVGVILDEVDPPIVGYSVQIQSIDATPDEFRNTYGSKDDGTDYAPGDTLTLHEGEFKS